VTDFLEERPMDRSPQRKSDEPPVAADMQLTVADTERPARRSSYNRLDAPSGRRKGKTGTGLGSPGDTLVRTVAEAATLLGISRALAYRLVRTGELRHIRLGRWVVVPYRAIKEMLDDA